MEGAHSTSWKYLLSVVVRKNAEHTARIVKMVFILLWGGVFPSVVSAWGADRPNPALWEPLNSSFYYNKKMVEKAPGVLLVWTYKTIPTDQRERMIEDVKKIDPEQSIRYQLYHHETILWELDCHAKLIRAEEFIDFDKDGKVLKRHRNPPTEWTPIFPKTGGEALYRKVCLPQKETIKKKRR